VNAKGKEHGSGFRLFFLFFASVKDQAKLNSCSFALLPSL
jgi:hypothetical protein